MTRSDPKDLKVYTFPPLFDGLPTAGPFGLKLEACLRLMKVPYERVLEGDNRKGPKRKSPWIVDGDVRMGDTELILAYLRDTYGATLDDELTPAERADSLLIRRAIEEHLHQVFEYELFLVDAGWQLLFASFKDMVPAVVRPIVAPMIRRQWRKHLFERGIARHTPAEVEAMGKADIDALATRLSTREWLVADHPTKVDATAFGMLAPTVIGKLDAPVWRYAGQQAPIVAFVERARARWFPELVSAAAGSPARRAGGR